MNPQETQQEKYLTSEYRNLLQQMMLRDYNSKFTIARAVKETINLVEEYNVGHCAGVKY